MSAWWHLTKKELRLGLPAFLLILITFAVILGVVSYIGYRAGFLWEAATIVSVLALGGHIFYLAYYLLYSLEKERKKLHLWLHNPQPGYALLLAKIAAGLITLIVSMLIIGTLLLISFNLAENFHQMEWSHSTQLAVFGILHIMMLSVNIAVYFIFFWMIFLLINRFTNGFFSFILTLIIFLISMSLYGWFMETAVYEALTMWGEINLLNILSGFEFNFSSDAFMAEFDTMPLYLGNYVFEASVTVLLFLAASWLLDRKVEV